MTRRPPRLALSLLRRSVPDDDPLVGDILEDFAARPSRIWFWRQVLAAVIRAIVTRDGEIRPLQLVDHQPLEALERTREVHRRQRDVSPTPNPLPAGLGLVILSGLITAVAPLLWVGLIVTAVSGVGLAWLLVTIHKNQAPRRSARRLT